MQHTRHHAPRLHERSTRAPRGRSGSERLWLGALALGLGAAGVVVFRMEPVATPVERVVLLADTSRTSDQQTLCSDISRLASQVLNERQGDLHLVLAGTGARSRGDKLERVAAWEHKHRGMSVSELGDGRDTERALLSQVQQRCEGLPERDESPLFDAARGAVSLVHSARDCGQPHVSCSVVMRTDLVEERDAVLTAAIAGKQPIAPRIPRIDNDQVEITFCGLAERRLGRRARSVDAATLQAAWLPEFTHPERVSFEESCAAMVVQPTHEPTQATTHDEDRAQVRGEER